MARLPYARFTYCTFLCPIPAVQATILPVTLENDPDSSSFAVPPVNGTWQVPHSEVRFLIEVLETHTPHTEASDRRVEKVAASETYLNLDGKGATLVLFIFRSTNVIVFVFTGASRFLPVPEKIISWLEQHGT
ncbi:hypothetical protein P280DRAFT_191980 [Massarina eburnea CBS 473.64]|uniref:Uncharacterized protein n=1 Tax=Massarina eburnea CBS 473.64 TaxID=1395130 RepID=A0A6A6RKU0_9PLEO|nr:hypothetical protein P280DRAFT_191980 [Massarina eburnea CBS 473.64]